MKLRLVLKTKTKKGKDICIKFNIKPSSHIGFVNFINLCLSQGNDVNITFEKILKSGKREESKYMGMFKFQGKDEKGMQQLEEEIQDADKKRKKQQQKRKQK